MLSPIKYLIFQAAVNPDKIAIQSLVATLTYKQLLVNTQKIASKLRSLGVKPGQVVTNCFLNSNYDWAFTLAAFHEAAVTSSNHGYADISNHFKVDWLFTDNPNLTFVDPKKVIYIDFNWIKDALDNYPQIDLIDYSHPSDICRLTFTSGTTGDQKAVVITCGELDGRHKSSWTYFTDPGNEVNMMGLSTIGGFFSALTALTFGAPFYVYKNIDELIDVVKKFNVNSMVASVVQIKNLLKRLEDRNESLHMVNTIRTGGAPLLPFLQQAIRKKITNQIYSIYGSTEVGGVAMLKLSDISNDNLMAGYLLPDVKVEVVDDFDQVLPAGSEGLIRIQTPNMTKQFYNDSAATDKFLRNGWFYSGDIGTISKSNLLRISGRESEIINLGGVKVNPDLIDDFLNQYPGVKDGAAFGVLNNAGLYDVALGLVVSDSFDLKKLKHDVATHFGPSASPKHFLRLSEIPRNQMGKPLRIVMFEKLQRISAKSARN